MDTLPLELSLNRRSYSSPINPGITSPVARPVPEYKKFDPSATTQGKDIDK